jgi:ActR/RegA family two-component response regulator
MPCECSQLPAIVRLDQHPSIERDSEELERDSWFWLVRCRSNLHETARRVGLDRRTVRVKLRARWRDAPGRAH